MEEKFETIAIRAQTERSQYKEHSVPLYLTSSYAFDNAEEGAQLFSGEASGYLYSRVGNPNTDEFARKMALLEGAKAGLSTASGMSAIFSTFASVLKSGDHMLSSASIFGSSYHVIEKILPGWGIETEFVDISQFKNWEKAFKPNTKLVFIETPSNPGLNLIDIEQLAELCHQHAVLLVVDNCFATPYLQQPIRHGADVVVHSATKFLDGQGRVTAGVICGPDDFIKTCAEFIVKTGPTLSPFNAWVLSKSIETLAVRMDRHCANALSIARFLESHPDIETVVYPELESHPQHKLARHQMLAGGGLVACEAKGGQERGRRFLNALKLHSITANLGDTRSIASHPASTTHCKLSPHEQLAVGITPGLIRFSAGLEHVDDIIGDIEQALDNSRS